MVLFGELYQSASIGTNVCIPPVFIDNHTICFVSGVCLQRLQIGPNRAGKENESNQQSVLPPQQQQPQQSISSILYISEDEITAIAAHKKEGFLAVAERQLQGVKFVKARSGPVAVPDPLIVENLDDCGIVSVAFSFNGQYLAALGDLPGFTVMLWDWRTRELICQCSNNPAASFISFNPLDASMICTSGAEDGLRFWTLQEGYKKRALKCIEGNQYIQQPSAPNPYMPLKDEHGEILEVDLTQRRRIKASFHCWGSNNWVYTVTEDCQTVAKYSLSGQCQAVCSTFPEFQSYSSENEKRYAVEVENLIKEGNMSCFVLIKDYLIVGGKDGFIRWIPSDSKICLTKQIKIADGEISNMALSPDFLKLVVVMKSGAIFTYHMQNDEIFQNFECHDGVITAVDVFRQSQIVVTSGSDGIIRFWEPKDKTIRLKLSVGSEISSVSCSMTSNLMAVGTKCGVLRLYSVDPNLQNEPVLLYRAMLSRNPIKGLYFDPTGHYLSAIGGGGSYFIEVFELFELLAFLPCQQELIQAFWAISSEKDKSLYYYTVGIDNIEKNTYIQKYLYLKTPGDFKSARDKLYHIDPNFLPSVAYCIKELIYMASFIPGHIAGIHELFYVVTGDRRIKSYSTPSVLLHPDRNYQVVEMGQANSEHLGHELSGGGLVHGTNYEWLLSWSSDGKIHIRSSLDYDRKLFNLAAHDIRFGGVVGACWNGDSTMLVTFGRDGIRFWEWKYSSGGKKAAIEAGKELRNALLNLEPITKITEENIRKLQEMRIVQDKRDTISETPLTEAVVVEVLDKNVVQKEKEIYESSLKQKLASIKEKLNRLIQRNSVLPDMERLDKSEFIINFEKRNALIQESDNKVNEVRKEINIENVKKRIIRKRIKKLCWDSIDVQGQSIKSFHSDPLTGQVLEVCNFPICKQEQEKNQKVNKVVFLTRAQLVLAKFNEKNSVEAKEGKGQVQAPTLQDVINITKDEKKDIKSLLRPPFELTTPERRRVQIVMLSEQVESLKQELNQKFRDMAKLKRDEIFKIQEKADRIKEITEELSIHENAFIPELSDEEVPERILQVRDSEIKSEKVLSQEEKDKLEAKRKAEEEKSNKNKQDDSIQRALMMMMNGRLEDRTEQEDKEDIIAPECMSKPKADWTEEDRKAVKEYEKKLSTFKEEQEKQRKALETELRKLQNFIVEICLSFDNQLRSFFNAKLVTTQLIARRELEIIKLHETLQYSEDDHIKEDRIVKKLEELNHEKLQLASEAPEIKKDIDRAKEEYDVILKREKDTDRFFKKEFQPYDFYFDALIKLYKRREKPTDGTESTKEHLNEENSFNPFAEYERNLSKQEAAVVEINIEKDLPEGLGVEVWNKLVEVRNKKIAIEKEVKQSHRKFIEMQGLFNKVSEEAEKIRADIDAINQQNYEFQEYKFHSTYNVEILFELKQGQVEVPQAPVVTDHSDAILIHRSVVEKLNEVITTLGQSKVEALKEMKEYRKGIHALEWENKLYDFQAEDSIVRTRDIQLLRVTKQIQEFIKGGDDQKQTNEIITLEKRAEHSKKAHEHKVEERKRIYKKLKKKILNKVTENKSLDSQNNEIRQIVQECKKIYDTQVKHVALQDPEKKLKKTVQRRRLIDLARQQEMDIYILRQEVERLRLKTFPCFSKPN